ncbi:DUF4173 domain-containing protein [bacterium]|nr:DUF4173 domain-containing protein [bacterium]
MDENRYAWQPRPEEHQPTFQSMSGPGVAEPPSKPPASNAFLPPRPGPDVPPFSWTELVGLGLLIVASDIFLYGGHGGYFGWGVWFIVAPLLLLPGSVHRKWKGTFLLATALLFALGVRLMVLGSPPTRPLGLILVYMAGMSLATGRGFFVELFYFSVVALFSPLWNLAFYAHGSPDPETGKKSGKRVDHFIIPAVVVLIFAFVFIMANPSLRDFLRESLNSLLRVIRFEDLSPVRVLFWILIFWLGSGLIRPILDRMILKWIDAKGERIDPDKVKSGTEFAFLSSRNTLYAVIGLFAAYLLFEFGTLWFRKFPEGFHYAGYAHEGAAWLTVALAISTGVLGLVFHGPLTQHPKVAVLRRAAWIWSVENLLLAMATFHRTWIYVDYNGMSRMRVVAILGISVVVAGFALVVWMVKRQHNLQWLIRRQLWALAITLVVLFVAPIDWYVTRQNVKGILAGEDAPLVQIAAHPPNALGVPQLIPLMGHESSAVRNGMQAVLAKEYLKLKARVALNTRRGWAGRQLAADHALKVLENARPDFERHLETAFEREAAIVEFSDYAMQWYD